MNTVVPLRNSYISEAEYDAARAKLRELYGDSSKEAGVKREQALAILFYQSGWTQEELARKEKKSPQQIARQLRFGRFLSFSPMGEKPENLPTDLNERRFRDFWKQTDKSGGNERVRFQSVLKFMNEATISAARRPQIGEEIKEQFADGKWRQIETIAEALDANKQHVETTIERMRKKTYGCKAEKKKVGTHFEYRIFKTDKTINAQELIEKLAPIVKELKAEGKKNMATMSPPTVAYLAGKLQKLLDEWAE